MPVRRISRLGKYCLLGLLFCLGIVACNYQGPNPIAQLVPQKPLEAVEAVPDPELPTWIEQISPIGEADALAQIRIRFKSPIIPLSALGSDEQQAQLSRFEITPQLPGQFRFLTPRMVGFQADRALPKATRIKVTLKAGLKDLEQHQIRQDVAWTFNTETIKLTDLPTLPSDASVEPSPVGLEPEVLITANTELDVQSVQATLNPAGQNGSVPVKVELKEATDRTNTDPFASPQEKFNPALKQWIYRFTPQRQLDKATRYQLKIAPGIRPKTGNLASETAFTGGIMTYAPLAFQGLEYIDQPHGGGAFGRFTQGAAQLKFNNGLVADKAQQAIEITPPPKEYPSLLRTYDDDRWVGLNPWALEPDTTYKITIKPELTDSFGQTLEQPVTLEYKTGNVAADLWAPTGFNIFPTSKQLQLTIDAVNLPKPEYQASYHRVEPTELVYFDSAYPQGQERGLLPDASRWPTESIDKLTPNQTQKVTIPLQTKLGSGTGLLAYGIQARTYQYSDNPEKSNAKSWREPKFYGMVQLTNLGVFTQWFPESGLVRVHHLDDGKAVENAQVEVYRSELGAKSRPTPRPCATGQTNTTGVLQLDQSQLQACMPDGKSIFSEAPKLLTIVREDQDWAFSRSQQWSGSYGYGIYAGWQGDKPISRGTIFSDRQLYQPGESAWLTGVAAYLSNGKLQRDRKIAYEVTLKDPKGNKTDLGTQTTNEFGTFSLEVPLQANRALGNYQIEAKSRAGVTIRGDFRVAEFKPPNFKVDLSLDREFANLGDAVTAQTQSNYLFGPALEGAQVEYYVTREKSDFTPKGWSEFEFGRRWYWPEEEPSINSDVLQTKAQLDRSGQGKQSIKVDGKLPYPMTYRVDAQVNDAANLSVAASKTFTALPSDRLIGLKTDFLADAGKPFNVQVMVTNPQGEAVPNTPVKLELQQMIYHSVTQVVAGSQQPYDQLEYRTVATAEVRSQSGPETVALTPPEAGAYRIRANYTNAKDDVTATDARIWATGEGMAAWSGRYSNNRLELQLDKETYKPGETAHVVIQSPYPEAELYFAIVRHNTLYQTVTQVKGSAPKIDFTVTPDMLPNAAVEAVLVRQGTPLSQTEVGQVEDLAKVGFASFNTDLADRYLQVQAIPQQAKNEPGAEETVQLSVRDADGTPVQGQVTVMAVNEAVLQLTNYRIPDLVKTVYADQPISVRFADNRREVVLTPMSSPIEKGWGFGGGLSAGAANDRLRQDFKPIAYYKGDMKTDTNGNATVKFTLPDDLTTWRVMAVATDTAMRFGKADATFMTTKPLMANPVLPQFARVGDRLEAGLSLTNTTGQSGRARIQGAVSGALQLADDQAQDIQTDLGTQTQAYRFPIVAQQAGEGEVQFRAELNGATDGFKLPLTVKPLEITEQVVETGTTQNQVKLPIVVDDKVSNAVGGLELSLASTLIPELKAPAKQSFDIEWPFLETTASRLTIAANLQILGQTYEQSFSEFNPPQQAQQAIEQMKKLQRPDGGFAFFPGSETTDPFVSAYAAAALAQAQAAKLPVDQSLISAVKDYLQKVLANPRQYDFCKAQSCQDQLRLESLMALAELGDRRNEFLGDLYDRHKEFPAVNQIKLARYLSQFPAWQRQSADMTAQIQESVYETGRQGTINLPQKWRWFSSPTTAQAEALRLMVERQAQPNTIDKLLSGLLSLRRDGTWGCSYYNAQALTALAEYSELLPEPPNFTATAQLKGKTLVSQQFQGYKQTSVDRVVPMAELPRGKHDVQLQKSGKGTLHYLATYRYRPEGNPPGRFNGLRVSRQIHPANSEETIATVDLQSLDQPIQLKPGQVFDIELEVITDHPIDHLVINDPLPAGLEAIDSQFQTATPYFQAQSDSWEINYQTIYRDRVMAYGDHLQAGVYKLHYLVRSVTPGTFVYPGAVAQLQYAPEEFGRSAAATLEIRE